MPRTSQCTCLSMSSSHRSHQHHRSNHHSRKSVPMAVTPLPSPPPLHQQRKPSMHFLFSANSLAPMKPYRNTLLGSSQHTPHQTPCERHTPPFPLLSMHSPRSSSQASVSFARHAPRPSSIPSSHPLPIAHPVLVVVVVVHHHTRHPQSISSHPVQIPSQTTSTSSPCMMV